MLEVNAQGCLQHGSSKIGTAEEKNVRGKLLLKRVCMTARHGGGWISDVIHGLLVTYILQNVHFCLITCSSWQNENVSVKKPSWPKKLTLDVRVHHKDNFTTYDCHQECREVQKKCAACLQESVEVLIRMSLLCQCNGQSNNSELLRNTLNSNSVTETVTRHRAIKRFL